MLKWCALTRNRAVVEEGVQCQGNQASECSYKSQDIDFCEKVHAVALQRFQQDLQDEICRDRWQFSSVRDCLKQENQQLKTWVKNIKVIVKKTQEASLKTIDGYRVEWESSVKVQLEKLNIENTSLKKEIDRNSQEMQFLADLIEGIAEENGETIDALNRLFAESPIKTALSIGTSQEDELTCSISEESGYATDSSEDTIKGASSSSSMDTILAEEPDFLTRLEKENRTYKEWVNSLHKKLNSNLTLQFIQPSKALYNLQIPSIENVELKWKMKRNKKTIECLQDQLEEIEGENIKVRALYKEGLEMGESQCRLDKLEEKVKNAREELEAIDNCLSQLQGKTELFTTRLQERGVFLALLKSL